MLIMTTSESFLISSLQFYFLNQSYKIKLYPLKNQVFRELLMKWEMCMTIPSENIG